MATYQRQMSSRMSSGLGCIDPADLRDSHSRIPASATTTHRQKLSEVWLPAWSGGHLINGESVASDHTHVGRSTPKFSAAQVSPGATSYASGPSTHPTARRQTARAAGHRLFSRYRPILRRGSSRFWPRRRVTPVAARLRRTPVLRARMHARNEG